MFEMILKLKAILSDFTDDPINFRIWEGEDSFYTDCLIGKLTDETLKLITHRVNSLGLTVSKIRNFLVFKSVDPSEKLSFKYFPQFEILYYLSEKNHSNKFSYRKSLAIIKQIKSVYEKLNFNIEIVEIENGKIIGDLGIDINKSTFFITPAIYPRDEFRKFVSDYSKCKVKVFHYSFYDEELVDFSDSQAEQLLLISDLKPEQIDLIGCNYGCSDNIPWVFGNISKRLKQLKPGDGIDGQLLRMVNLSPLVIQAFLDGNTEDAVTYFQRVSAKFQFYLNSVDSRVNNQKTGRDGFIKGYWLTLDEYLGSCISWWSYEI